MDPNSKASPTFCLKAKNVIYRAMCVYFSLNDRSYKTEDRVAYRRKKACYWPAVECCLLSLKYSYKSHGENIFSIYTVTSILMYFRDCPTQYIYIPSRIILQRRRKKILIDF